MSIIREQENVPAAVPLPPIKYPHCPDCREAHEYARQAADPTYVPQKIKRDFVTDRFCPPHLTMRAMWDEDNFADTAVVPAVKRPEGATFIGLTRETGARPAVAADGARQAADSPPLSPFPAAAGQRLSEVQQIARAAALFPVTAELQRGRAEAATARVVPEEAVASADWLLDQPAQTPASAPAAPASTPAETQTMEAREIRAAQQAPELTPERLAELLGWLEEHTRTALVMSQTYHERANRLQEFAPNVPLDLQPLLIQFVARYRTLEDAYQALALQPVPGIEILPPPQEEVAHA